MTQDSSFQTHIENAKKSQSRLNDLYRKTIGLIDSLKNRSRKFMNQVSDIEDGLAGGTEEDVLIEKNIHALAIDIKEFNRTIGPSVGEFAAEVKVIMKEYEFAVNLYQSEKGQLSSLLNGRKRLLFLDVMSRKFRNKINSLQQMNNILFSFTDELREVKESYKSNLSLVSSELAASIDSCEDAIKSIESLK